MMIDAARPRDPTDLGCARTKMHVYVCAVTRCTDLAKASVLITAPRGRVARGVNVPEAQVRGEER